MCDFPFDLVNFAATIDEAASGAEYYPAHPAPRTTTIDNTAKLGLEAVAEILEKAATKEDQLKLSCGLPLTFDTATQRYKLAPTAAICLKLRSEMAHRPPPKLDLSNSKLFARRTSIVM
jgi:hypothetical protein